MDQLPQLVMYVVDEKKKNIYKLHFSKKLHLFSLSFPVGQGMFTIADF